MRITFIKWCERNEIKKPDFDKRELEHLQKCEMCQKLWPLVMYYKPETKWESLTEQDRFQLFEELEKHNFKNMKSLVYDQMPSAYQLFLREETKEMKLMTFQEKNQIKIKNWKNLEKEKKQEYEKKSKELKDKRISEIKNLPKYFKRIFNTFQREKKNARIGNKKHIKNPFITFVSEKWKEKCGTIDYQTFLKETRDEYMSNKKRKIG